MEIESTYGSKRARIRKGLEESRGFIWVDSTGRRIDFPWERRVADLEARLSGLEGAKSHLPLQILWIQRLSGD